ncbi:malto-oligosyltrehalose trehalohydrolase [Salinimicrobium soli]|uniref:malto-oligosyltrehalose trehalohydrolase n=1 Tax=Salinimicrobium soli TaxID=1254399 RepID=UPI003AABE4AE
MSRKVGAAYTKNGTSRFSVWSPFAEKVELITKQPPRNLPLEKDPEGYWKGEFKELTPGTLYKFKLDEEDEFPDPASLAQPEGVHSWSKLEDTSFEWEDFDWKGRDLDEMVIYELHVGTFTPQGTFEAIIERLDHFKELGVNTIELMPISQFPGSRNWGYDGVYPFASQDSYGGIEGLKKLVNACHQNDIAIILDVVYNHLGPEGNYLSQYGPYFTDKYHTPWGSAVNFDDEYSDQVRRHFIDSALMWLEEFHFDGLRLDAIHEIIDRGARHFLQQLSEETDALEQKTGKRYVLIAESDLNDTRLVKDYQIGGYGLEGQWVDDFHHSLHTVLTSEDAGYYKDYGKMEYLAKAFRQAFVYDGKYSEFRKRTVGNSPEGLDPHKFVVSIQNHDQVGNRLLGERIASLVSFEKTKLAAGVMLASPFVPMLFMGEEFGETNPFRYFVSHGDKELVKAVQEGRKREFEYFNHAEGDFPDPQAEKTFEESKLNWNFRKDPSKNAIFEFYKEMLRLRKDGAFDLFRTSEVKVKSDEAKKVLEVSAAEGNETLYGHFNFSDKEIFNPVSVEGAAIIIASSDKKYGGKETAETLIQDGSLKIPAGSFVIYRT